MIKRMLIDNTQPEETRVVVINGNKLEDVEFETSSRRQIKGNVYLGKVMRVEPSLQACFVDYGGNKHGFMAFGEIHPDYYNVSEKDMAALDKEIDDIIESKKQSFKDREAERERIRLEKNAAREKALQAKEAAMAAAENAKNDNVNAASEAPIEVTSEDGETIVAIPSAEASNDENADKKNTPKKRVAKKRYRKQRPQDGEAKTSETNSEVEHTGETPLKVLTESAGTKDETICEEMDSNDKAPRFGMVDDDVADDDDDEMEMDFELQRKLMKARKLFHRSKIQDVIKEGQILLVQVVKEERGNKGAALTTYLSLAGRYCVLMPNRIKSGGVSRKITNAADRNRLKGIVRELPLTSDMSMIVRTAGEEKSKADIVRDYNYLIRTWNQIREGSLLNKAPALIHEEGNLIKRALRDIYTKEISEIIVAGEDGYRLARDFFRILSPHNLKKIKLYKNNEMPLFQRFQVEGQLDKLHESTAQLESGGYLVINPTEALISIDVNSGRATKEKDLEDTALKTNLEACDEVARQLRMRNLAGLVVIDFIDMEEQSNNHAIEKRMKEAMKKDRSRIQIGKMSMFGLLELSRQRMHSSFFESSYQTCPHCNGKGITRTTESSAVFVLRGIEEEGIKNRSARLNVYIPTDIAIYLLNQKRQMLLNLEQRYKMEVIISADDSIKNITDYRLERIKKTTEDEKPVQENKKAVVQKEIKNEEVEVIAEIDTTVEPVNSTEDGDKKENCNDNYRNNRRNRGRDRRNNRRNNNNRERFNNNENNGEDRNKNEERPHQPAPKQEAVILYNSHGDTTSKPSMSENNSGKEKPTWWKKLIKG